MYNGNKSGPKTDPCGTPHVIGFCSDIALSTETNCFLFIRYEENH